MPWGQARPAKEDSQPSRHQAPQQQQLVPLLPVSEEKASAAEVPAPASADDVAGRSRSARCRVELSPHVMSLIRGPLADAVKALTKASVVSDGAALQVALGFSWQLIGGNALVCGPNQVCRPQAVRRVPP